MKVRLFASYRESVGAEWLEIDLPERARARDLLERLAARLGASAAASLVARRMEYIGADALLAEGDELAVLPPLSGGGR